MNAAQLRHQLQFHGWPAIILASIMLKLCVVLWPAVTSTKGQHMTFMAQQRAPLQAGSCSRGTAPAATALRRTTTHLKDGIRNEEDGCRAYICKGASNQSVLDIDTDSAVQTSLPCQVVVSPDGSTQQVASIDTGSNCCYSLNPWTTTAHARQVAVDTGSEKGWPQS
jgi:hypothetical protein